MAVQDGWSGLFAAAFERSRNPMLLTDGRRGIVDVNPALLTLLDRRRDAMIGRPLWTFVSGGPLMSEAGWAAVIADGRFTGEAELLRAGGAVVAVQWAATTETVTGRRMVLFVAVSVSRWGARFRRDAAAERAGRPLTPREREIVQLVSLGAAGPEIGEELHISHETVRTHIRNAMEKLGARSRAHLVAKAIGDGLMLD